GAAYSAICTWGSVDPLRKSCWTAAYISPASTVAAAATGNQIVNPRRKASALFENDLLCTFPEDSTAEHFQLISPLLDGGEMITRQGPGLAPEGREPIGKEDLGLADPTWIEQELPRSWIGRVILVFNPGIEVTQRHPGRLTTPARLAQLSAQRKELSHRLTGPRRGVLLQARREQ